MSPAAPPATDLNGALQRLGRLLASRRVVAQVAETAGVPLTQQAIAVLRAASDGPARPVAEVARGARMDVGAVSRQLKALEEAGLIERRASPAHGSIVLVEATPAGRERAERVRSVRDQHLADALAGWTAEEQATLARLLGRLVDDLQATPFRPPRP